MNKPIFARSLAEGEALGLATAPKLAAQPKVIESLLIYRESATSAEKVVTDILRLGRLSACPSSRQK